MTTRELFQSHHEWTKPDLKGMHGSWRFDVEGEGKGSWCLKLDDNGHVQVDEVASDCPADCVIVADDQDMVRVLQGNQNALTAAMQGRLRILGDLSMAKFFHTRLGMARHLQEEARK
jgi:putative sterol carrier protein